MSDFNLRSVGGLIALVYTQTGRSLPTLPTRLPLALRVGAVAVAAVNWVYLMVAGT